MPIWSVIQPAADTTLRIEVGDSGLCGVWFGDAPASGERDSERNDGHPLIREAARQLEAYFNGHLRRFDLPLDLQGTPFQKRVWERLREIPYGKVISYLELARAVDSPKGFRAVGAANGRNPIPIIVPCHRVINSGGGLGGFSCGVEYKRRLLDLESSQSYLVPQS